MTNKKPLPPDSLVDYSSEGVPIARKMEDEVMPDRRGSDQIENAEAEENPPNAVRGVYNKKRQGTEDAQKRSDTGTGF